MAYITREDGERFVIPSYRDVLSAKNKNQLKKDIHLLSQNYGEYITMQKKNAMQFEVAFSPDVGYLLGETVWQHFQKPDDLIYCEAIPGSTEVILTIVKDGSVYLDGSFPTENVQEELIVFLTQDAHFEIFTYGDVPIVDSPEDGKFSFDPKSVKSYTILDQPTFQKLPLIPSYKLKLVDTVLKQHGIGVTPILPILGIVGVIAGIYFAWSSMHAPEQEVVVQAVVANPYQEYINAMKAPLANVEIGDFNKVLKTLLFVPGWQANTINYASGSLTATMTSNGGTIKSLYTWARDHGFTVSIMPTGFVLNKSLSLDVVDRSDTISNLDKVMALLMDKIFEVNPGDTIKVGEIKENKVFRTAKIDVALNGYAPLYLDLVTEQFAGLPLIVKSIKGAISNGIFTGTISLTALGK